MSESVFAPNDGLTKEQAMLLVLRSSGLEKNDLAREAVELGLISEPESWQAEITREEFASAMAKAYKLNGGKIATAYGDYVDSNEISDEYYQDIMDLTSLGIIKGGDDGAFYPKRGLSRAEAATIIARFYEL